MRLNRVLHAAVVVAALAAVLSRQQQLFEQRDLALTTDFRAVFAEVASGHLGANKLDAIFPGYGERRSEWVGLL